VSIATARVATAVLIAGLAGCGTAEKKSEVPLAPPENEQVALPARPAADTWIEFFTPAKESNRFYVDSTAITAMPWGEIRYTLRIVAASGIEAVSFEGVMCKNREWRPLAFLRADGSWSTARDPKWMAIHASSLNDHHHALYREYLCEFGRPRQLALIVREFKKPLHGQPNSH
jgi:hypothetical protein